LPLIPGARLGPYEVVSLIGSGGMGEVYRARDTRLDRTVAIKIMPSDRSIDPQLRMRFDREAKAAAAVSHPHICSVFDIGWQDDAPYIVMENLDGENLAAHLVRGPILPNLALEYAIQVAGALREAHKHGVIHRDLKPSNVVVTSSGVKLVDFGVAKLLAMRPAAGSSSATRLPETEDGMVLGSLHYMAPEQLEGRGVDARADIFSFGAVLFEMLTGTPAFVGDSKAALVTAVLTRQPPRPSSIVPDVPRELDDIVRDCLTKQSSSRPTSEAVVSRLLAVSHWPHEGGRGGSPSSRQRRIRALVVLPVETRLRTESPEAFAEGMTDGLISALARFHAIRVISRTSSLRYRASSTPILQIGRELRVDAVLAASVGEDDTRGLSLNAELIDAVAESRIWSASYTFDRADVLRIQEQVADDIARHLRLSIPGVHGRILRRKAVSRESHEAYLKGRFCFDNRIGDWLETSFDALQTAIQHDREFAPAHAALSRWFCVSSLRTMRRKSAVPGHVGWIDGLRKAEEEARFALRCDPQLGEAHAALGRVMWLHWRFAEAEDAYSKAFAVEPNAGVTHGSYCEFLTILGRLAEAIRHGETARELDPLATYAYEALAGSLYAARRAEQCAAVVEAGLELAPNAGVLLYFKGKTEALSGDCAAAAHTLRTARQIMADHPAVLAALAAVLVKTGNETEVADLLNTLVRQYDEPTNVAEVHAAMGNARQALDYLEAAYERRTPGLLDLAVDPAFDPLRSHPRFLRLLRAIGLPVVEVDLQP